MSINEASRSPVTIRINTRRLLLTVGFLIGLYLGASGIDPIRVLGLMLGPRLLPAIDQTGF